MYRSMRHKCDQYKCTKMEHNNYNKSTPVMYLRQYKWNKQARNSYDTH